jgi:uncharacterized protein (TIGR03086 family)
MTSIGERYRRHAATQADQWSRQSPCEAWSARDVVDHIVALHAAMMASAGRTLSPALSVQQDPLAAFQAARSDVGAVLDDPDLARSECDTPEGRMTVERHIDEVVSDDLVLHGWDLARATGQDDTIDPGDLERIWSLTTAIPAELMDKYRTPGAFGPGIEVYGPEVGVAENAPLQDRLLGLIGRDPHWTGRTTDDDR